MRKSVVHFAEVLRWSPRESLRRRDVIRFCHAVSCVATLGLGLTLGSGILVLNAVAGEPGSQLPHAAIAAPAAGPVDPLCAITNILAQAGPTPAYQSAGTRRMVERLQRITRQTPPDNVPYLSAQRAALLQTLLPTTTNVATIAQMRGRLASELLRSGRSEDALREFDAVEEFIRARGGALSSRSRKELDLQRAVALLRLGEQENCQINHTSESCLLPIQPGGYHQLPRGSRGAIEKLSGLLGSNPNDLLARWLLNIAYMTLGEYPAKVPSQWLIPPKCFESDYDIKRFPDVAGNVGLDVDDLAGGTIVDDFDGDGFLDVVASAWGMTGQLRYFRNNGNGTFSERTREAGLWGIVSGLQIVQTDYNNDGYPDIFVLRGAWLASAGRIPNSLLRNNGNGTFDDVTEEAGILSFHPTQTATWFDFDNDGWLDVFIGNESVPGDTNPCELFRNNGNGTFTECAEKMGVNVVGFVKGVTSGDYNNDGRPDLYLSIRDEKENILFRNDGPLTEGRGATNGWKFTNVTALARVPGPVEPFPTWFWDYDNDGWLDIMVSGYATRDAGDVAADYLGLPNTAERPRLYHNNHDGTFTDVTAAMKLDKVLVAMGANFGDLDNDGWLDFYLGTGDPDFTTLIPNRMFRNAEGKFFQDVTTSGGFGHLQKGHGISFADLDNDGDQDIYEVIGGAYSGDNFRNVLFLNPGHGNRWITLKLEGVKSNRAAIGARIKLVVKTGQGERSIHKTVGTGASFGASPLRQEIGLGQAQAIVRAEIFWPVTGKTQVMEGLEMDHLYKIREDGTDAVQMNLASFKIPTGPSHHQAHSAQTMNGGGAVEARGKKLTPASLLK